LKILLLNQVFYPDVVATAQQLTDLAVDLAARGHEVTVVAGDHGYDDPSRAFPASETYKGVRILRVPYSAFGKKSRFSRALDFGTFLAALIFRLLVLPRQDVVVALTSPPLIAWIAAWFCRLKGGKLVYWVMDMNPDEAIAAGWLKAGSIPARPLKALNRSAFHASTRIVALDRFMAARIARDYDADPSRITVLPPWAHDEELRPVPHSTNVFRREHGLDEKFVVMYSGNHSPCHPLDTVLEAAARLKDDSGVVFYFIGGGSLVPHVREFARSRGLANVVQLPYQPIAKLSDSLSAADLHVTVMGAPFVGIVHPCKVYGVLAVGRPFVYVGPEESAMADLVRETGLGRHVAHGNVEGFLAAVAEARQQSFSQLSAIAELSLAVKDARFSRQRLSSEMVNLIEKTTVV
jgi:glycosyltransferase involved in cell wall biosynthesis